MPWHIESKQPYGVYKALLIPLETLKQETEEIKDELLNLKFLYEKQAIPSQEIAFRFFWLYLNKRTKHPLNCNKNVLTLLPNRIEFLQHVRFRNLPDSIRITFLNWFMGKWNPVLLDYNPTSYQMLEWQAKGIRIISIDWNSALNALLVFNVRDAFEHFLHDIEHAYNFYRDDYEPKKQILFYSYLLKFYPEIEMILNLDESFKEQWDYLISDMNSHPEHLKEYTKAIFYEFFKRNQEVLKNQINIKKIIELIHNIDHLYI